MRRPKAGLKPHVSWCVEQGGTLILDAPRHEKVFLGYPEAALWDFITRGIPRDRAERMLAAVAGMSGDEAGRLAAGAIASWIKRGWMERQGE